MPAPHLKSDKHARNVRRSGGAQHLPEPWCNPPDAVQINRVDEPDQTIVAPEAPEALLAIEAAEAPDGLAGLVLEAPEGRRCRGGGYGVQSSDGDWEFVGRPGDILTWIEELGAKQDQLSNEVARLINEVAQQRSMLP